MSSQSYDDDSYSTGLRRNLNPTQLGFLLLRRISEIEDITNTSLIRRYLEEIQELIDAGANPNFMFDSKQIGTLTLEQLEEYDGYTLMDTRPLHIAVYAEQPDLIELLLQNGADPNQPDINGNYPLSIAIRKHNSQIIKQILMAGADPMLPDEGGISPLSEAVKMRNPEIVDILLRFGADSDQVDKFFRVYPLDLALRDIDEYSKTSFLSTQRDIISLLLAVNAKSKNLRQHYDKLMDIINNIRPNTERFQIFNSIIDSLQEHFSNNTK